MATGTLTSTTIASRYKSLLKLTGTANDVLAADDSAKYVEDGDGNDSVFSLSTTRVGIGNTAPTALLTAGAIVTLVTDGTTAVTPEGVNVHITEASKYAMGIKNADASGDGLLIQAGDAADDFALRVEDYDSANDLLVVQGGGNVGINTAAPASLLHIAKDAGNAELTLAAHSDTGGHAGYLTFKKSDNTEASPALVDDDDILGGLSFQAFDGSNWHESALIKAQIDGTPSDGTDMPTELTFSTTNEAEGSPTTRMVISPAGNVGIGVTTPQAILSIAKEGSNAGQYGSGALHLHNTTTLNKYSQILFGYDTGSITNASAYIGYLNTDAGGQGKGELVFGTRNVVTDTQPTERMRITADGNITATGVTTKLSNANAQLWIGEGNGASDIYMSKGDGSGNDEEVRFSKNAGGDLDVLTNAATFHLDQDGEGYYSGGNFGIGGTPDATTHLQVKNDGINTTSDFYGIYANHTKTLGASSVGDLMTGLRSYMVFNDADAAYSNIIAGSFEAIGQSSSGECVGIIGIDVTSSFAAGDINSIYGAKIVADINGGTIDSSAYGIFNQVDMESGLSGSFDVYGYYCTTDSDTDKNTYMHYLEGASNTDWHYLNYSGTVGSTTSRTSDAGQIDAEGTINASQSLDYAEYFESKDGKAIAVGTTVKLDGDKIVACENSDTPIGVIRPLGASGVVGGAQHFHWQKKHEKDDYDGTVMEDFTWTSWKEEAEEAEYVKRKDEKEQRKYKMVEGSEAVEAKDGVEAVEAQDAVYETVTKQRQKVVLIEVEKEVSKTEIVLEDGKYVQKTTTETITKKVKTPQYEEVTLYDEDGEEIGTHQVPIMEDYEEEQLVSEAVIEVVGIAAVAAVDAVANTYFIKHKYHTDRIPSGLTAPDDAYIQKSKNKRPKLNSSYDASKEESYKSREERDEWCIVGLLGQIPITKGQPMADSWIKMKDISDTVEMYFVK